MNITLPRYFIIVITSLVLLPLFFALSSSLVSSAADHVVISEVQIRGDDVDDEFVELFNPTSSPIVMENWQLRRMTSSGTESNLVSDIDATIPAYSYFLIAPDEYDGTTTRDLNYSTTQRLAANNSVAIYSHETVGEDDVYTLVDLVGMGTATVVETLPVVPGPDANGSLRRLNNDDTDNNSVDFEVLTLSDPQNSSVSVTPTASSTPTVTVTPTPTSSSTPTATASPTATATATASPITSSTPTPSPEPTATSTPQASPTPRNVVRFFFPNMTCSMQIKYVRFGFWRMPFAMMVCERS